MTPSASPWLPLPLSIASTRRETADVFTLRLTRPASDAARADGASYTPGQFNMLYAFGVGEVAISISGDASERGELVHTIRRVGAVTERLGQLRKGDVVGVRGPFGRAWPIEAARGRDLILIAGGLGLAPLRPLLYEIIRRRSELEQVALLVGARTPADLIYRAELPAWSRAGVQVLATVDRAGPAWNGHVGVVTALLPEVRFDAGRACAFVCGPEVMMRFAARDLVRAGVTAERIFLSMERNMKCAVGLCGHCQLGAEFICKDGPVFSWQRLQPLLTIREL